MTLGFMQKFPKGIEGLEGESTHFVEKIWASLIPEFKDFDLGDYEEYLNKHQDKFNEDFGYDEILINPKHHTIRKDEKSLWKVGMKIHPVINNRTKDRFQFAPVLRVKAIQKIEIIYSNEEIIELEGIEPVIKVGDKALSIYEMEELAVNDGFESIYQFLHWFNSDFKGKIIHWTKLKY